MFRKLAAIGASVLVVGAGAGAALAANGPGTPGQTGTAPGQVAGTCVPKLDGTGPRAGEGTCVCQHERDGTGLGAQAGHGYQAGLRIHANS